MPNFIVVFDIDKIHDYVFGTSKLKEIRGASSILNNFYSPENIGDHARKFDCELIYSAGGCFLISGNDESKVLELIKNVKKDYYEKTVNSTISAAYVAVEDGKDILRDNINTQIQELFLKLKFEKSKKNPYFPPSSSIMKVCDSCGKYPAAHKDEIRISKETKVELICDSCNNKRNESLGSKKNIWEKFINYLKIINFSEKNFERPSTFEQICNNKDENNFIGIIYGDGNGMGNLLKTSLKTGNDFKVFSEIVDRAVHESTFKAVTEVYGPLKSKFVNSVFPVDFLMLGGDDVILAIDGKYALKAASLISIYFNELTTKYFIESGNDNIKNINRGKGIQMSLGVAIIHPRYPFVNALKHCEELLRSAKKAGRKISKETSGKLEQSFVDFSIVTSSSVNSLEHIRKTEYSFTEAEKHPEITFQRTQRPYSIANLNNLLAIVGKLAASDFPSTKVSQFAETLFENKLNSNLEAQYLYAKISKKSEHKKIVKEICDSFGIKLENIPWTISEIKNKIKEKFRYDSAFLDILDLYKL